MGFMAAFQLAFLHGKFKSSIVRKVLKILVQFFETKYQLFLNFKQLILSHKHCNVKRMFITNTSLNSRLSKFMDYKIIIGNEKQWIIQILYADIGCFYVAIDILQVILLG
jgi:hypothetical protein